MIALLGLALAAPTLPAEIPFGPPQSPFTSTVGPQDVAAGDLDRDGDLDLVVAWSTDGVIAWVKNDGLGGLTLQQTITASAAGVSSVELADLDGDGDLDLLAADDGVVSWEFDSTLGEFATSGVVLLSAPGTDLAIAAGDADGDGDVDLYAGASVMVFLEGNGDGTFQPGTLAALGLVETLDLLLADVDRDGDLDPVASLPGVSSVAWFPNDGSGALAFAVAIGAVTQPGRLATADIDGDGDLDVVAPSAGSDSVAWYENTGTPTVSPWPIRFVDAAAPGAFAAEALDFDRDGDVDVVSAWDAGDAVVWHENLTGSGISWAAHTIDDLGTGARAARPVDLDADGDEDLVALFFGDDEVSTYENLTIHRSAGAFARHSVAAGGGDVLSLDVGDVDGDGDLDLLVGHEWPDPPKWYQNDGTPGSGSWAGWVMGSFSSTGTLVGGDVDGDGDLDALSLASLGDSIRWFENDGTPTTGHWPMYLIDLATADLPEAIAGGDVDGDGDLDALVVSSSDDSVRWFENDGTPASGSWLARTIDFGAADFPIAVVGADIDRDGDLDAVVASQLDDEVYWFENDGTPANGPWPPHLIDMGTADRPESVAVGDVDGDGDLDVLLVSTLDSAAHWFENDGTPGSGLWTAHLIAGTGLSSPRAIAVADLDQDGDLDALVASRATDRVQWFENDGTPGDGPWPPHSILDSSAANRPTQIVVGDIDRDGDLDAALLSTSDDRVLWLENRGGQFGLTTEPTPSPGLVDGAQDDLMRATLRHLGRSGDGDEELATVGVRLRDGLGTPLSAASAASVLASLSVWHDADDSGSFDPGLDQELVALSDFSSILMSGTIPVPLVDGDPAAIVPAGDSLTFFLVAETTADASAQGIGTLEITLLPSGSGQELTTAEDRDHDLPLVAEHADDVVVSLELGLLFADGFESGNTSAWSSGAP